MKKITIAIAICSVLTLTACGKTSDTESSTPTSANDPMTEQNTATLSEQQTLPGDQPAETSTETTTQTEQAAFEVDNPANAEGEMTEGTNK